MRIRLTTKRHARKVRAHGIGVLVDHAYRGGAAGTVADAALLPGVPGASTDLRVE